VDLTGDLKVNTKAGMAENSKMIVLWGANIASQPNTARHSRRQSHYDCCAQDGNRCSIGCIGPGLALHCKPVTVRTPHLRRAHAGRTIHGEQLSFRNAANRGECPWISDCKASAPL
jgi:hypothetical protein